MLLIGRVLWWDKREQEGLLVDSQGREYFFNRSCLSRDVGRGIKDGALVRFKVNCDIKNVRCAKGLSLIPTRERRRVLQRFHGQLTLDFGVEELV